MLTEAQKTAVDALGNVLVMAGAGTGKTSTLVERCLAHICRVDDPVALDQLLMVTFTEAAAAEMRQRLRAALEARLAGEPGSGWLAEQLALLESAQISTLHSFCLRLVRENFHVLGLDPQVAVLTEEQAQLLKLEVLGELLDWYYEGDGKCPQTVQQFVLDHGSGKDDDIRNLVLEIHEFRQSLRDPDAWLAAQVELHSRTEPVDWENWLAGCFPEWRSFWLPVLDGLPAENTNAHACAAELRQLPDQPSRSQLGAVMARIHEIDQAWPKGRKGKLRNPFKGFFDDAAFLASLAPAAGKSADVPQAADPLAQDWAWAREPMLVLLQVAREFGERFAAAKRTRGAVDFADLEQFALRVLVDPATRQPSEVASRWREQFRLIFVDEYQDINEAQDALLQALGRAAEQANRFLVGDVKQSIYRFRRANPHIFQEYARAWSQDKAAGSVCCLQHNFRSHPRILAFVNQLFASLMRREIGGVEYDDDAALAVGATPSPEGESGPTAAAPRVEIHLALTGRKSDPEAETTDESAGENGDLSDQDKEARLVITRLRQLRENHVRVWDPRQKGLRPVDWSDMVILLRSPKGKVDSYAREFTRQGIPFLARRAGFYESSEVMDLLCVLQLLDNPLQDEPLLAVLRSPLAGLSLNELAEIRLSLDQGPFWTALQNYAFTKAPGTTSQTVEKIGRWLERHRAWRALARQVSLSQCLEQILDETGYEAWLLTQARGAQRRANVQQLLVLTREFDQFQRQGLYRFLAYVKAQVAAEIEREPASLGAANAVRLMSIHQSKGLEFPVVAVADLGKGFRFAESLSGVILDERFGLCPLIKPPHSGSRYPSLPCWLARRRQRRETLGEELRLLYVATTRARDFLLLSGLTSEKNVAEEWPQNATAKLLPQQVYGASRALDWLGRWLPAAAPGADFTADGHHELFRWQIYGLAHPLWTAPAPAPALEANLHRQPSDGELNALQARLEWEYPFPAATREPAKATVTALRRRAIEEDESRGLFQGRPTPAATPGPATGLTAAEIGTAHHAFMQAVRMETIHELGDLVKEADRLQNTGWLTAPARSCLELPNLLGFFHSEAGRLIRQNLGAVHRELPFTARFGLADLASLGIPPASGLDTQESRLRWLWEPEFVVVQGVIDLAVIRPDEIWILDYKTDQVTGATLGAKVAAYQPQIELYSQALSRIYRRPVTRRWLHFLRHNQAVELPPPGPSAGRDTTTPPP